MGIRALFDGTEDMVQVLNLLTGNRYFDLTNVVAGVRSSVMTFLAKISEQKDPRLTLQLEEISSRTTSLVGGKAGNLARIECDLKMRVPRSFVVTTEAYREFLEVEGLASKVRTVLAPARLDAPDDFRRRCELAQDLVRETRVPPAVVEAIRLAYHSSGIPLAEGVAVRSSAAGEDSALSFAGQFETVLNVTESGVAEAWKRVVVSRFSPGAVFYRRAAGLAEVDTPMAVLVQRMVSAQASGVLFTRRPEDPKAAELLITAVRGLGAQASTGIAIADEFVVSRGRPAASCTGASLTSWCGSPASRAAALPNSRKLPSNKMRRPSPMTRSCCSWRRPVPLSVTSAVARTSSGPSALKEKSSFCKPGRSGSKSRRRREGTCPMMRRRSCTGATRSGSGELWVPST